MTMKRLITLLLFIALVGSLQAQRRINPAKQIYMAPDSAMILRADENGELQFEYLADVAAETDCKLVTQAAHGFSELDMVTFSSQYDLAMTDTATNLPLGS